MHLLSGNKQDNKDYGNRNNINAPKKTFRE